MNEIKSLFKPSYGVFGAMLVGIIVAVAISVVLQSLLIWIGGLFPSVDKNLGVEFDGIVGMLLVFPIIFVAIFKNFDGNVSLLLSGLAIIGIYDTTVWFFNWIMLITFVAVLLFSLNNLDQTGCNKFVVHGIMCSYLIYCIGAYYAMIINGIEPVIDIYGIIFILLTALYIGFTSVSDLCSKLKE